MEKGNGRRCACLNQWGSLFCGLLDSGERCLVDRCPPAPGYTVRFCCIDAWCARDSVRSVRACRVRQVRSSAVERGPSVVVRTIALVFTALCAGEQKPLLTACHTACGECEGVQLRRLGQCAGCRLIQVMAT